MSEIPDYKNDPDAAANRLEDILIYEGTEVGETWESLVSLWNNRDYLSEELQQTLEKEIISEAIRSHKEFKLIEEEVVYKRLEKNLEYIG